MNFSVNDTTNRDLLSTITVPADTKYTLWISFYELYNDQIHDLLVPRTKKDEKRNALKIREDGNRTPYVEGLIQVPISNTYEAIKILKYGEKNLQKGSNTINMNSSRSHAVFCVKIVSVSFGTTVTVNQYSTNFLILFLKFSISILFVFKTVFLRFSRNRACRKDPSLREATRRSRIHQHVLVDAFSVHQRSHGQPKEQKQSNPCAISDKQAHTLVPSVFRRLRYD